VTGAGATAVSGVTLDELNYITVERVGDNAAAKREWLRAEWERLTRQRQELLAETIQLQASQDVTALRAHAERLAVTKRNSNAGSKSSKRATIGGCGRQTNATPKTRW
jgi:hypothetical protein